MKVKKLKLRRKVSVCKRCEKILTTELEQSLSLCCDCREQLMNRPKLIETPELPHKTNNDLVLLVDDLYLWGW